jgi:two-component system, NarL family, invasion response regulator UvrY
MIRILIADDHTIVREGLKQILAETGDMTVMAEAGNGQEALDKILRDDFDVVVLDIAMPGRSGLDILKDIRAYRPKLPVLVLSMYPEEQYAVRVLRAGADGYLTKESAPNDLITAIRRLYEGKKYISSSLAEKLAFSLEMHSTRPPHELLSDREYQVLCRISSGKTVKEIAQELSLSVKTISTYRSRILEKMAMKNNAELTFYAVQNHLVN